MLIAAITAFLLIHFSGHSAAGTPPFEQTAALITKNVADEARRKQALAIVDQMEAQTKTYTAQRDKSIDAVAKLTATRATPFSDIRRAIEPLIAQDRATAEQLLDLRFKLKSVLTETEWTEVFPAAPGKPASPRKTTARYEHHTYRA